MLRTLGHVERVGRWCSSSKGPGYREKPKRWRCSGSGCGGSPGEEGFTWATQDRDREMVNRAWQQACIYLPDAAVKLVLLDEINMALKPG